MVNDVSLPKATAQFLDPRVQGVPSSEWRKFFEKLSRQTGLSSELQAEIAAIIVRLDALEEDSTDFGSILGIGSVQASGTLGDQVVIQLEGDNDTPGASYYYGTDANGDKGFWPVPVQPTRGITVTGGSIGGSVIPAGQAFGGLSVSDYTLTGNWYLWCSPTGSIELDVRKTTFGALPPGSGDTICGGNEPAVTGGISDSGDFTGWTPAIARDDALTVVVNSVTDVTWFVLLMEAV